MRISDWSSDVCSSDLRGTVRAIDAQQILRCCDDRHGADLGHLAAARRRPALRSERQQPGFAHDLSDKPGRTCSGLRLRERREILDAPIQRPGWQLLHLFLGDRLDDQRSEEHTSELQSLMRTSYAVFCLKKTHS